MSNPVAAAIDAVDETLVVDLTRRALMTPSLSGEERAAAELFAASMDDVGMEAELQKVPGDHYMPESWNAIGRLPGTGGGVSLLFNGHIDHNPVCEGWTRDPFGGVVEDGWLYGFVHMKAADACYVAAVDAVRKAGIELAGDVVIAHVCGELRGGTGTRHALQSGITADYFLLGEPTELEIATNHSALLLFDIHVLGAMKHYATADVPGRKGVNAVEKVAAVIAALGRSHRPLPSREAGGWLTFEPNNRFSGLPQLNLGSIRGGISRRHDRSRPALMPDVATLTVDLRLIPGMTRASVEADLRRLLDGIKAADPDFDYEIEFATDMFPHVYDDPPDSAVVKSVVANHRRVTGQAPRESELLKYAASDASWMSRAGIPGIVYGPTGKYLSRPDERGRIADLVTASKVYAGVIADLCGRGE